MTKKDQILAAAEVLFSEHGYEGTSVRMLAKEAKVNIAMINYYFGSKENLFSELVEYRSSFLREKLKWLNEDIENPVARIERLIDLIVDKVFSNPRFHRLVHREISLQQRPEMNARIVAVLMKNLEEVRKMLQDGIKKKVFRNVDVDFLISSVFSTTGQTAQGNLFCSKLLGMQTGKSAKEDELLKKRLKAYLNDFLKCYLIGNKK
jgi:AcrR family transcriptional regulator